MVFSAAAIYYYYYIIIVIIKCIILSFAQTTLGKFREQMPENYEKTKHLCKGKIWLRQRGAKEGSLQKSGQGSQRNGQSEAKGNGTPGRARNKIYNLASSTHKR